jgi:hypothetical protein
MELFTNLRLLVFETGVAERYRLPVELNLCRFTITSNLQGYLSVGQLIPIEGSFKLGMCCYECRKTKPRQPWILVESAQADQTDSIGGY